MPKDIKFPQVYFRVDRGNVIGEGHLFRDKALAAKMKEAGYDPVFITRPDGKFNESYFFPFKVLTLNEKRIKLENSFTYDKWLGVSEKEDVKECIELVNFTTKNIWIIDHYGINEEWEKLMVNSGQFVVAIDDLFKKHHSHIVLDHNLTADKNKYSSSLGETVFLMGTNYALLREDICKAPLYDFDKKRNKILLFLGSVDSQLFYKILKILRTFNLDQLQILNPPSDYERESNEEVVTFCDDLPRLYDQQKLVIGSCGVAHLERIAMGIPSISCVIVDNQIEVGKKTNELDITVHLGDLRTATPEVVLEKISSVLKNPEMLKMKSKNGIKIFSRSGTEAVMKIIQNEFEKWLTK